MFMKILVNRVNKSNSMEEIRIKTESININIWEILISFWFNLL